MIGKEKKLEKTHFLITQLKLLNKQLREYTKKEMNF